MCEYRENGKNIELSSDSAKSYWFILHRNGQARLYCKIGENEIGNAYGIKINHCLMCGRDLTEDQPMFQVIYISPSCNQGIGFINALAVRLKWCGITDFTIDEEHIQLKSDKFIVSAVDICGANLGRSHHVMEYYIDKVSVSEYPSIRTRENVISRLKELKCRFRKDTKEISEEELIEILTEVST